MIVILSGTNRPGSNTRKVSNRIAVSYEKLGVDHQVLDLAGLPPGIFSPSAYASKPADFKAFTDPILDSHGLVVVTLEYNGGIPGVFERVVDILDRPLERQSIDSQGKFPVDVFQLIGQQVVALRNNHSTIDGLSFSLIPALLSRREVGRYAPDPNHCRWTYGIGLAARLM